MKQIYFILCIGLLTLGLASCKDFLETNPTSSVSDQDVFTTVNGAQAALNGAYYQMELGGGGSGRQDDWGYATHQMTFDADGEDIIVWGGWYTYDYNYWGHTRGDIFKAQCLWYFYYRLVNNTNSIIAYIDAAEGDQISKDNIKGQAYALRGWAYFNLIRLFQHTYAIAKDMPGVPIYTEPTTDETIGKPRGTVEDTYKQIISDFEAAESLLGNFNRSYKNHMDRNIVRAFLSQVYMTMNQWDKAAGYARQAREGYPLTSNDNYLGGFNDLDGNPSWMWGMYQTKEQNLGDYSPFAMWANWDYPRDGNNGFTFQCFYLCDKFVELFDDGDVRKTQFEWIWDMIHISHKFRDNAELIGSIVFMRSEEMLLNEAECLARQGKDSDAKNLLWQLQDLRGAQRTTSSGNALIEDILIERRKEMYGEGYSWYDMIRNQKPLLREGNHINFGGHQTFPAKSWRFVYQVPNNEIVNNPNMSSELWPNGDQNPFDGVLQ